MNPRLAHWQNFLVNGPYKNGVNNLLEIAYTLIGCIRVSNPFISMSCSAYDDSSDFDASELVDESENDLSDDENKESGIAIT